MKIGQRIKERRKELKISAEELGKRLGKDRSTIYRYENGDIENMPLDILPELAIALELPEHQLMGWNIEEEVTKMKNGIFGEIVAAEMNELTEVMDRLNKDEGFRQLTFKINQLNPAEYLQISNLVDLLISNKHSSSKDQK